MAGDGSRNQPTAAASGSESPSGRSWFDGKAIFWWPWPLLVALDLWSKSAIFEWLIGKSGSLAGEHVVFEGRLLAFRLVTWENPGTIWGLFQDSTIPLIVLRCVAVIGLLWFVRATDRACRGQLLVLSLIFAGAVGNLYDNLTRVDAHAPRSVRDFLRFSGEWPVDWGFPAFNVADSCITCGAIGLMLLLLREDRASRGGESKVSS